MCRRCRPLPVAATASAAWSPQPHQLQGSGGFYGSAAALSSSSWAPLQQHAASALQAGSATTGVKASRVSDADEDKEVAHSAFLNAYGTAHHGPRISGMQEFAGAVSDATGRDATPCRRLPIHCPTHPLAHAPRLASPPHPCRPYLAPPPRAPQLLARQRIPSGAYADPLGHIFDEFDADRDGALSAHEVAQALRSRNVAITDEQAGAVRCGWGCEGRGARGEGRGRGAAWGRG